MSNPSSKRCHNKTSHFENVMTTYVRSTRISDRGVLDTMEKKNKEFWKRIVLLIFLYSSTITYYCVAGLHFQSSHVSDLLKRVRTSLILLTASNVPFWTSSSRVVVAALGPRWLLSGGHLPTRALPPPSTRTDDLQTHHNVHR
jgi:hypothetical protein